MSAAFLSSIRSIHYRDHAEQFLQQSTTRPSSREEIEPWRRGRARYWCWCIEVDNSAVLARLENFQQHLSAFLLANYQRQPHITVAVCGFWLSEGDTHRFNDDFSQSQLAVQRRNLEHLAPEAFKLQVLGGNSFQSAPFLEVVDDSAKGNLEQLRRCLLDTSDDFRSSAYCPHITLGLYNGEHCTNDLLHRLTLIDDREPLSLKVSALSLMSYDSADLQGALKLEQRVLLSD
ncbi:MAG: 2'-5' RNA ligase family protein [Cellvibrionaceae bacterium]